MRSVIAVEDCLVDRKPRLAADLDHTADAAHGIPTVVRHAANDDSRKGQGSHRSGVLRPHSSAQQEPQVVEAKGPDRDTHPEEQRLRPRERDHGGDGEQQHAGDRCGPRRQRRSERAATARRARRRCALPPRRSTRRRPPRRRGHDSRSVVGVPGNEHEVETHVDGEARQPHPDQRPLSVRGDAAAVEDRSTEEKRQAEREDPRGPPGRRTPARAITSISGGRQG